MSRFFKNWKFYIIDIKIPKDRLETCNNQIITHGGQLVDNIECADVVLTILKTPIRLARYVPETRKPICSIDWVAECQKNGKRVPYDGYLISLNSEMPHETSRSFQKDELGDLMIDISQSESSSSNESHFPRTSSDLGQSFTDEQNSDIEIVDDLHPRFLNTKYECFRPTPLTPVHNQSLVELLQVIEHARELDGEGKSALAYRHAISALKVYPCDIRSYNEARKIIGIGPKIGNYIREFLSTGSITEAEEIMASEKYQTLDLFSSVYGVGHKTALSWYRKGYRSMRECNCDPHLTHLQRLGLELFDDFQKKMSRQDIQEILNILDKEVRSIYPDCIITPVGGYRRGKEFNGDLDVVISHPQEEVANNLLNDIVERLIDLGYLKHKLFYGQLSAKNKKNISHVHFSFHRNVMDKLDKCFCAFIQPSSQICRQVDLIIAPYSQYPTAVLGWTGEECLLF
ncbi:4199_t:CDS:10 [Funneliformis mosseae]|uniref:DNA polymerase n=1 Tax=Funneliformis mosseae TaxID=27381 RepID=A0A9N8Z7U1_FUNMO|nr:4199_t:CDS:10 [Funneliformis mosseae]